jgi:RHS repeat-associated protein
MKNLFLLIFFCVCNQIVAQVSPSTDLNSVIERMPRVSTPSIYDDANTILTKVNYFDGRSRPTQSILHKGTPDKSKDVLLSTSQYDIFSRPIQNIIVAPSTYSNGSFDGTALSKAINFYGDAKPYTQTDFESSPSNRPLKNFGAGEAWYNNNKFVEIRYESAGSDIREYRVSGSGATVPNNYANNSLYKKTSISERGFYLIEYADRLGKVIQKDVQDDAGWMQTAYIYDDMDRLAYVLPPLAFDAMASGFTESDANFTKYVFAYHYDNRGRVAEKHIPGAGWTYIVYDLRDQPVLVQDALQRVDNKWSFTKYDRLGRIVVQGELTNSQSRTNLQTLFDVVNTPYEIWQGASGYTNVSFPISYGSTDERLMNFYDQYDWIASQWNFNASIAYNPTSYWSNVKGLQSGSFARSNEDPNKVFHSVIHYDDKHRVLQTYQVHHKGGTNAFLKPIITNYEYNFVGEVTKEKILYQLDGLPNTETIAVNVYDHVGRILNVYHGINATPEEQVRLSYDEIGRMIQKKILPNGNYFAGGTRDYLIRPSIDGVVTENNTADVARQYILLEPKNEINSISLNTYSAEINPTASQGTPISGLQTMNYAYHIRGGLRGINLDNTGNPTPKASEGDLFSYKLDYETTGFYDGNIGKQTWQTADKDNNPTGQRSYTFSYDASSRLKTANYAGIGNENYTMPNLSYDKNGNITALQRKGKTGNNTWGDIDILAYQYDGNRLSQVTDGINTNNTVDLVPRGSGNYTYYADGSLKSDENEQIANIIYDTYLKQPSEILLTDGRKIKHFYDGGGRLFKTVYYSDATTVLETWEYIGKMAFKNGQFFQVATPEGRASYANNVWSYEFSYSDHLGNTRVSFRALGNSLVKVAETAFDPFGVVLKDVGKINGVSNRFEFQGKESDKTFGLNRINLGARTVNPTIGRFDRIDVMAEKYFSYSTYNYVINNPLIIVDPDGRDLGFIFNNNKTAEQNRKDLERHINNGLGGYYTAKIDEKTGKVSLSVVEGKSISEASESIQTFYNVINDADKSSTNIVISVDNANQEYGFGDYDSKSIDIVDINALENMKNETELPNVASPQSKLGHEVKEQTLYQESKKSDFSSHHIEATKVEEKIIGSGVKRGGDSDRYFNMNSGSSVYYTDYSIKQGRRNREVQLSVSEGRTKTTITQIKK